MLITNSVLRLNFDDGEDEKGNRIIRSRNYGVSTSVEDAKLVEVGEAIFGLTTLQPVTIERVNTVQIGG